MYNTTFSVHTTPGERKLAKIYLFCLPFRMFALFSFLPMLVGPLANFFDSIINIVGLIVWYNNEGSFRYHPRNKPLFQTILYSVIYLNISSVLMSIVMYASYGNCNGESPFWAIIPMILFYFQYVLMFLYNIRVFAILDYATIRKVLDALCKTLLVLGYIQVVVMLGIGGGVYDAIVRIIGGIRPSSEMPKLCLTLSEGAAAGCLMGTLIFPYILAKINNGEKRCIYELVLWMPLLFYTHSSTALILFAVDIAIFVLKSKKSNIIGMFTMMATVAIIVVALMFVGKQSGSNDDRSSVTYLLFEKAFDKNNGSTISRTSTFGYNWGAFTEMPLMGVGNGLQGYFYNKYFPMEYLYMEGTDIGAFYEIAQTGIVNGECFLPGYFSGYGIFGLIVLLIIVSKMRRTYRARKDHLGIFGDMFPIGAIGFFVMGLQGEAYCLYYAWFVVSIPFMYWEQNHISKQNV